MLSPKQIATMKARNNAIRTTPAVVAQAASCTSQRSSERNWKPATEKSDPIAALQDKLRAERMRRNSVELLSQVEYSTKAVFFALFLFCFVRQMSRLRLGSAL
jgi:hypothetical protein